MAAMQKKMPRGCFVFDDVFTGRNWFDVKLQIAYNVRVYVVAGISDLPDPDLSLNMQIPTPKRRIATPRPGGN
jgi:hypothetical protein